MGYVMLPLGFDTYLLGIGNVLTLWFLSDTLYNLFSI